MNQTHSNKETSQQKEMRNAQSNSFEHGSENFRLLLAGISDYSIMMLDPDGYILSWNSGAERNQGYKADEIVGQHFRKFYTQADVDRKHPEEELRLALEKGRYEEEGWRVRKDGSQIWVNAVLTPLRNDDGVLVGYSKVTRDLTEKMKAERALRESEERFRLMVASVKDYAIIMLDPKGHVISWNAGAERIKGWSEKEIIGKSFETFYPREDIENGKTRMELEVATAEGSFEDYGWRVRKDGRRFWANVIITALRDDKGNLRGFSKVTRDITERKRAEEELKKAYEELESFSYSVSHDLRAPLRSMDGFSEVLQVTLADKLDERSKNYLGRIRESAQKMATLIDDLLNLSRLGRAPVKKEKVHLSEMAQKIVQDLKRANPERNVNVSIASDIWAEGDTNLVRIALENLLNNAWKYTSKKENAQIEFGQFEKSGQSVYFVKDNGAGFDMAFVEKLFGAFQRLHGVNEFPGNGIGLATVKRIVHKHGGNVRAEGKPNEGSTFYFTLKPEI